jgi:hypothetical protein
MPAQIRPQLVDGAPITGRAGADHHAARGRAPGQVTACAPRDALARATGLPDPTTLLYAARP